MPLTIREAFAAHALRAEYESQPAMVLPVTDRIAANLADGALPDQDVEPGQLLVAWNENGARRGKVLEQNAGNDVVFLIPRSDGTDVRVPASSLRSAALRLIGMAREDVRDRRDALAENDAAQEAFDAAVERGETPEPVVPRIPAFADGAFDRVDDVIRCVDAGIARTLDDPFADIVAKSAALAARYDMGRANANVLTPEQMERITTARALREEIGALQPEHPQALAPAGQPYRGEGKAKNSVDAMDISGQGFSAAQMSAVAGNPVLVREVFSVLTTTPAQDLVAKHLDATGFASVVQDLARHAENDWSVDALASVGAVLADRMPGYRFDTRMYTKDDTDILLVRDHAGAYLYAWDRESRVAEINVNDRILSTYSEADVPGDDDLHALRIAVREMRHDNGAEIDFAWGDAMVENEDDMEPDF